VVSCLAASTTAAGAAAAWAGLITLCRVYLTTGPMASWDININGISLLSTVHHGLINSAPGLLFSNGW